MWAVLAWQAMPSLKRLGFSCFGFPALIYGANEWRRFTPPSRLLLVCAGSAITAPLVCHSLFPGARLQSFASGASGCATFRPGARSPGVDHNHDRGRDWGPRTPSIRSISIGWRWVACHRNNTRSIPPRSRQPWASGMIRYRMG
jgi:hypothetical protein